MAKVPIHFMGFLGNLVDDSVTEIQLGEGFVIESGSPSDVRPFLIALHSDWGIRGGRDIWPEGCFRVVKQNIAAFDATGRGGVAADPTVSKKAHTFVQDKLRFLRLFKDMKDLYNKRSKIVHDGKKTAVTRHDTLKLRSYTRETLKEVMRIGTSKNEMLRTLRICGFGQRPWRENAV